MTCIQCDRAPAEHLSQFCAGCAREHRMAGEYDQRIGDMEYEVDFSPLMRHAATHEERRTAAVEHHRKRMREDREDAARWRAFDARRRQMGVSGDGRTTTSGRGRENTG